MKDFVFSNTTKVYFGIRTKTEGYGINLNVSEVTLTDMEFAEPETELNKCRVYRHRGFSR